MKDIRVLNYAPLFLPHIGGIEENIYYFARYGRVKHLVLTERLPDTANYEQIDNIEVYRAGPTKSDNKSPIQLFKNLALDIPRELRKSQMLRTIDYDILHLRAPYLSSDLFYAMDCVLGSSSFKKFNPWSGTRKPVVATFHLLLSSTNFVNPEAEKAFWIKNEKHSWRKFEQFVCSKAEIIVCVDQFMIDPLHKLSMGKEVQFIPSGIDLTIFRPIRKEDAVNSLPSELRTVFDSTFTVLFLGRLDPMKGVDQLDELADRLPEGIRIVIVGDGKQSTGSHKVIRIGKLPNSMIPYVLNSCDVLFQPLILEGISRVALEGLACGKPVVMMGRHLNRYPIIDGRNGFVVDNITQAKDTIEELYRNDSLYRSIINNAVATSKDFDVRILAKKLDKVYETCYSSSVGQP